MAFFPPKTLELNLMHSRKVLSQDYYTQSQQEQGKGCERKGSARLLQPLMPGADFDSCSARPLSETDSGSMFLKQYNKHTCVSARLAEFSKDL